MKRTHYTFIVAFLLIAVILTGCRREFRYVDDLDLSAAEKTEHPWDIEQEFSYLPSKDSIDNVINLSQNETTKISISNGTVFLTQPKKPMRYDPKTNAMTLICTDPLCDHIVDCPFSLTDMNDGIYCVGDSYLYFRYTEKGDAFVKYDAKDRTLSILRTITSQYTIRQMAILDDCYYYIDVIYDEKRDSFSFSLCRQYYDSKKIDVLKKSKELDFYIMGADSDTVYYYDYVKKALVFYSAANKAEVSSVKLGNDFYCISLCKDGYIIFIDEYGKLMRINTDGSDLRSLGISDAYFFYLTNSYIYYVTYDELLQGKIKRNTVYGEKEDDLFLDLQAIYRMDHEGNNKELVWKNQDMSSVYYHTEYIVIGNYIYTAFDHYYFEDGYFTPTLSLGVNSKSEQYYCRIDITSGEYYFIKLE